MKHVTELIVAKNEDYNANAIGALRIMREDGSALVAGNTIADAPKFYIEQQLDTASPAARVRTGLIEGANIVNYKGEPYTAPVLGKVTITLDDGTVTAGVLYKLWIIFKSEKQIFQIRKSYEHKALSGDTYATVAAALRTLIGNDTTLTGYIAESGATDTIILTAVAPSDIVGNSTELDVSASYFDVARNADLESIANVADDTVIDPDPGHGTFNHVRLLEWETKGYKGHLNRVQFADDPTFYSATGTNYGSLVIDYDRSGDLIDGSRRRRPVSVNIVSPSTWTGRTTFESILNGYMASVPGAFSAQTSA